MNALQTIQQKLKSPKSEWNEFGNFHYRTKESILQSLKPFLEETNTYIQFNDRLILLESKVFIESQAELRSPDDPNVYIGRGFARHADEIPKMQAAQITGSTLSYAQKGALESLFLIDDGGANLDAMKPNVTPPKKDYSRPPAASGAKDNKNPWLNAGTKEYSDALQELKTGKTTLDKIKASFRVSAVTEKKIISEFK